MAADAIAHTSPKSIPSRIRSLRASRIFMIRTAATLSPAARHLLRAIVDYCNDAGTCWPSVATLADDTGISDRHIRRLLRELETGGWIAISARKRSDGSCTSSLISWIRSSSPPLTRRQGLNSILEQKNSMLHAVRIWKSKRTLPARNSPSSPQDRHQLRYRRMSSPDRRRQP